MNLYTVTLPGKRKEPRWAGSQAEAAKIKNELWDAAKAEPSDLKRGDIEVTGVDVPTDKGGLLKFLNSLS